MIFFQNQSIFDSKVCYISSTYNTGWLYGDVRCALLMSTQSIADQPYITTNHVVGGDFSNAAQWSTGTGWSISGGQAVHNGSGASSNTVNLLEVTSFQSPNSHIFGIVEFILLRPETRNNLNEILEGNLNELINPLIAGDEASKLAELGNE